MSDERPDRTMARALRGLDVPEHGRGFWTALEDRLAAEQRGLHGDEPPPALPAPDAEDVGLIGTALQKRQNNEVVTLRERVPTPEHHRGFERYRLLLAAAVLAIVALTSGLLLARNDGSQRVDVAVDSDTSTTTGQQTTAPPATDTTVSTPASGPGLATPDDAVLAWLDALGSGDIDAAAALTGPRSRAYIEALGGTLGGLLTESQEGWGAWAASPDRTTTEVDLGTLNGAQITIVVVMGTWTGEGTTENRADALPAVTTAAGGWLVEPFAFDPDTGGRIEVVSPSPASDGLGLNGLAPDETIEVRAEGDGTFYFSLDDADVAEIDGVTAGGGTRATWDPPGELRSGSHLLVAAYIDDTTITAFAGVFTVET